MDQWIKMTAKYPETSLNFECLHFDMSLSMSGKYLPTVDMYFAIYMFIWCHIQSCITSFGQHLGNLLTQWRPCANHVSVWFKKCNCGIRYATDISKDIICFIGQQIAHFTVHYDLFALAMLCCASDGFLLLDLPISFILLTMGLL